MELKLLLIKTMEYIFRILGKFIELHHSLFSPKYFSESLMVGMFVKVEIAFRFFFYAGRFSMTSGKLEMITIESHN